MSIIFNKNGKEVKVIESIDVQEAVASGEYFYSLADLDKVNEVAELKEINKRDTEELAAFKAKAKAQFHLPPVESVETEAPVEVETLIQDEEEADFPEIKKLKEDEI